MRVSEEVDVGDIQIIPGHRLRGRVTLSDGAAIVDGMRATISADRAWDSQTAVIGPDGHFEFVSLPRANTKSSLRFGATGCKSTWIPSKRRSTEIDDFAIALDPVGSRLCKEPPRR
jgi:hypothetical protein